MVRRAPISDAKMSTLAKIAQHGAAVRHWFMPGNDGQWSWRVGGQETQGNVCWLYAKGYLEPDNGERDRLKISAKGQQVLRQSLGVVGKAAA
jgi:hypothetical protein